ncbi:dihydrolipoamide acetyltransferase [Cystobacter fuscus]|uniref:Dihydrolipoamide acetyltransferase n=1 Tax=Cystobacter fuscus TaxID=43 RepID=A0A250J4D7_9BACT|nr:biotin/lipoyl-containing protein [Cystobacter fuscus]ATB38824.1 dihydrolipoamide acetyltransferase [Cystobacter fuscus]
MALRDVMISGFDEGLTVATIVRWHVKSFDTVQEGQVLAEVLAGRTPLTVSSPWAGYILVTHGKEAEQVKVHQPLVTMDVEVRVPTRDNVYRSQGYGAPSFVTQFNRLSGDPD